MMEPDAELMKKVRKLRTEARFLDAWELLAPFDPPEQWKNAEWRASAARLMENLDGDLRAQKIWFQLWRQKETRHVAREDMVWEILGKRGPFLTWQWLQKHPPGPLEDEENHHDHFGMQAYLLGRLRDFERAEQCLARLLAVEPESVWARVLKVEMLLSQDRNEDALALANEALKIDPAHVSGIMFQHAALIDLGRDVEALERLQEAAGRLQSGAVLRKLALLQIELKQHDAALKTLDEHERVMPLMEDATRSWQAGRRCDIASAMGNQEEALRQALLAASSSGFYKKVAAYLEKAQGRLGRLILPVGFVAQHQVTCAPATVSAVAGFMGREVGHLELADEICYDGTPHYRERAWAEQHGWAVREFRVTVESAKQLIDRRIPVILTTAQPDSAHAQAVIGYDEFRQVLFVRDPSYRTMTEFLALEALEEQAPFGPRGLVMVPQEEAARFDGLELPEAALYDLKHSFDTAITNHDRAAALVVLEKMREQHADERMRWHLELALARYDDNSQARLDGLEALLKMFPDVVNWQLDRLQAIRELRGREAQTAELRAACAKKDAHPLLWRMLGRELHWEDKHTPEARRWMRRVHRDRTDSIAILTSANMLWDKRQWEQAAELYRIASCLDDKNANLSMCYFKAARWIRCEEEALALLRERFVRDGHLSAQPAQTLHEALDMLNRGDEALKVLDDARARRGDDGGLALYQVRALISIGSVERAREVLAEVKSVVPPGEWQRCQALLSRHEADNRRELEHWRAVLVSEPLATDAHRSVARLLELLEGREPALRHLRTACEQFPFQWHLHDAWLDWVREDGPVAVEPAVRDMLRIDPRSAWAWRELAVVLRQQKRYDEAHVALAESLAHQPLNPSHFHILGGVLAAEGRVSEALKAYRRSIELDADTKAPMHGLLGLCKTQPERLDELRFIQGEITRQVTQGDGVLEFAELARPYLDATEMEVFLRDGYSQRPDLWQTGVTLAQHLRAHGQADDSIEIMTAVCDRFPLLPRVWMELGACYDAKPDREKQIQALNRVREMNPAWGRGMRNLAAALKKDGRYEEALEVMQHALSRAPTDAWNHGWVGELHWHLGHKEQTFEHLQKAVACDPDYSWAWNALRDWGEQAGRPGVAKAAAESLTTKRPAEARSWLILADMLTQPGEFPAQLAALDRAMEVNPRGVNAYEEKARLLALAGRFDEAFTVCEAHPDEVKPPMLIAREAWVLWKKQERKAAVARMQSAVKADPGLLWGWNLFVEWHQQMEDLAAAEEAVQQVSRLEPAEPTHLGMLAQIREKRGDKSGAVKALVRALEIAPDYPYSLHKLIEHHCANGEYANARQILEESRPHHAAIEYLSRLCVWHLRQAQCAEAQAALLRMVVETDAFDGSYNRVLEVLKGNAYPEHARRLLHALTQAIQKGTVRNGHAGAFYVSLAIHLGRVPQWHVIKHISLDGEGGELTLVRYINGIGERWGKLRGSSFGEILSWRERWRLDRLMEQQRELLRANHELWGTTGYALYTMKRYGHTAAWLADWRERADLEPYMLNNLFFALQHLGRQDEAAAVLRRGLELPRHDDTTMRFHLFAALEDALASRAEDARRHLAVVHEPDLSPYSKKVLKFVEPLLQYQPGCPSQPFSSDVSAAFEVFLNNNKGNKLAINVVKRACLMISRHNRSMQPRSWFLLHQHGWKLGAAFAMLLLAGAKFFGR